MSARPTLYAAFSPAPGLAAAWVLGAALLCVTATVQAQDGAAQLSQIGQRFVNEALHQDNTEAGKNKLPLRMEVQMGQLDSRLRLAACAKVEPYLPAGSRLWGRTRLGLRCVQGSVPWNVFTHYRACLGPGLGSARLNSGRQNTVGRRCHSC